MIFILDKSMNIRDSLSNSGEISHITPFFDDIYTSYLETGAETYQFSTLANTKESQHLIVGNHIAFQYEDEYKLFTITEIEETHDENFIKTVYCEMAGLKLINKVIRPIEFKSTNLRKFLEEILSDTDWNIGLIDIGLNNVCDIEVKDYTNAYSLLQTHIRESYKGEIHFTVKFEGSKATKYINVYSNRGQFDGFRFSYDSNLTSITRTINFDDLATALIGVGNNGLTFKEVETEDKPLNQDFITDESAYLLWNDNGSHILGYEKFDTDSPQELLKLTREKLKERCQPKIKYELNPELLGETVKIGDTVYVIDNEFNPPIHLSARINQLSISLTDKSNNSCVLSNFTEITSNITEEMRQIASQLEGYVDGQFPIGGDKIQDGAINGDKLTNGQIIQGTHIFANSITADHIQAETIDTEHLKADSIDAEKIQANSITSNHIQSNTIETEHLKANIIQSEHIQSNTIDANHIISNSINSGHIQTGSITAGSGIIADGAIGNAQISSIDAGKIEAGTIDTSKVTVQGSNGHLRIKGNRLQVFNGTGNQAKERVSVGDVNGDGTVYGLRVRGADGQTVLLDENGVTNEGITDGSITNEKISDDANIDGAKLNINSVVSKINEDGTETIQGTKIEVDGTTLNTKLSTITNKQTEDGERITQAQSQISANTNAIKLKVDEQTYTTDKKDMTAKLEKNTSEITAMKGEIALKVEQTDIENAINEATLSRADFIARNFLSTPLIVSDSTLPIYTLSGIPNPPIGSVFGGFSQERNVIKNNNISSNGSAWAIIVGYEFYKNTTDNDKKNKIRDIIKKVADFMANNVSIGRFNSMDFNFIDTNYKYDSTSKSWVKSNYKEIYISTLWLQVKAMVYAYEILKDNTYSSLCFNILDSLFNTHFYINAKVASNELPTHLEWSSYEYLACDNLSTNYRFVASTKQYANQMGYYIHQAIPDVIRVFGDNERPTPKGDIYKPSDILVGLKKYLKNAYDTQNITAKPLGLPYGYFHRVENGSGGYDYIPQNWNFIEDTWGDGWFVGDVVTYTIYAFAASGLTDIAREYADNYYKLRVNVKDDKWSTRFNASELIFYDRVDFYTGSHLSDDDSISITYTALYYEILKQIGKNEHIDACCYTLAKHQINNLDNKNIDGGYPWDISRDDSSLEFKSFGEIINSQFYKNLNITSFTAIDNKFAEIKVTTDSISQNVSNLSQTVSNKADGSTVTVINNKVTSLETSVNGISGKVTSLEKTTTTLGGQVSNAQNTANTANNTANSNKTNITNLQGEVSTVKSNVASLEVTTSGISQKVSSVESTTSTLTTKVNTAQSTADSAKTTANTANTQATTNKNNISTLTTTVNTTNNKVATLETNLSGITSRVSATESSLNTTTLLAKAMSNGKMLYTDPMFKKGTNSVNVYNNSANGTVTVTRISKVSDCPTTSTHCIEVKTTGTASPGNGGFYQSIQSRANAIFIQKILAKVPTGCNLNVASNNMGDGYSDRWLTSNKGTGKWEEYIREVRCGSTGTFSIGGHVYVSGVSPTTSSPLVWYMGMCTAYDITDSDERITDLTSRVSTAESKLTKDSLTTTIGSHYTTSNDVNGIVTSKGYQTASQVQQTVNGLQVKVSNSGGYNLIYNGNFKKGMTNWGNSGDSSKVSIIQDASCSVNPTAIRFIGVLSTSNYVSQSTSWDSNETITLSYWQYTSSDGSDGTTNPFRATQVVLGYTDGTHSWHTDSGQTKFNTWEKRTNTITPNSGKRVKSVQVDLWCRDTTKNVYYTNVMLEKGALATEYTPNPNEIYDGITTIDRDGITVKQSNISTYTTMDASSFRVENNTGGTVAEFSQNSQIPNLSAGIINANEIYANNVVRKSTYVKNYYVAGVYGNDVSGAGDNWNNPCKTVQYVLDNYVEDVLDYDVNIYVGQSVPGWTCKSKSGKGVISFLIQDDCIVRDPLYLDNCTNRIAVQGTDAKKGTFMTGIVVTGCHNFDIGWVSFRGKNWAHNSGSCNVLVRSGSKGIVRFNDFNGCSFAIIVENNSEIWMYQNRGSDITHYVGIGAYATIYGMRSGSDVCPDFTGYYYADAGHSNLYHIHDGANYTKTPSIGWSPSYTPTQKTQTWSFNKIWSDETLHGWSDRQELIQGYASTWNTGRWTGYMQMTDGMAGIRNTISGGTNLSGRIYVQRTSSSGNSTGSKLCLYASDGTLITNSTSINRSQGVWVSLSSSIIQKIQSGAITYFYLKADSNNTATYFKCESNAKIEITYTK